ncbi:MAG: PhnD/SsuA/transferrin family substrate-binding protein, partial [Gammaproteobacteria bacterium]|nr:PhnD/SsuA/transferrin family substrate-binding protein [Gammaproteobacteria bacterium]
MLFFLVYLLLVSSATAGSVSIGVLAYNGNQQAMSRWQPTADYLSRHIPDAQFQIVPLTLVEFEHAINKGELDFILTNPGHYVRLEVRFGVTRIATFLSEYQNKMLKQFSAVIFTRKDSNIFSIKDLKGRVFAAVSKGAFGGFQLAQDALMTENINALEDMEVMWLGFPHADIVKAVLDDGADAGVVRSGVLEKMAAQDKLELSQLRILGSKQTKGYPFLRSVNLYPEWPFSKLPDTDIELSKKVAISLFEMSKDDEAAVKSVGSGWTIPLSYASVHDVLRRVQAEPYPSSPLVLSSFWQAYQQWIVATILLFLISLIALTGLARTNRRLKTTQQTLHQHQGLLEETVQQRTDELLQSNQALQDEVTSHIKAERTLSDGCESLQSLYAVLIRTDLDRQQKLNSIVELVRQYLGAEFALLSSVQDGKLKNCSCSPTNAGLTAPLSEQLSQQAISDKQILLSSDDTEWRKYIACPVYIKGELHCLFEFVSSSQYQAESGFSSELSLSILKLISQWVGNETMLLEKEKLSNDKQQDLKQRFVDLSPRERQVLKLLVQGESTK